MSAKQARLIRRRSQRRSQNRDGLGVSELFLAPPDEETLRHLLDDAERFCVDRLGESV